MLKIYHVPGTRSVRVIWLAEELGLSYEVIPVDFSAEYRSSSEWRALNPVGKVPVMIDGDLTLFESGAMVQVVLDRTTKVGWNPSEDLMSMRIFYSGAGLRKPPLRGRWARWSTTNVRLAMTPSSVLPMR